MTTPVRASPLDRVLRLFADVRTGEDILKPVREALIRTFLNYFLEKDLETSETEPIGTEAGLERSAPMPVG